MRGGGTHISISHISIIWALYILYLPFWHHDRPTFERLNSSGSSGSEMDLGGRAQRAKILNSTSSYLISLFEMRPISYICDIRDMSAPPHQLAAVRRCSSTKLRTHRARRSLLESSTQWDARHTGHNCSQLPSLSLSLSPECPHWQLKLNKKIYQRAPRVLELRKIYINIFNEHFKKYNNKKRRAGGSCSADHIRSSWCF